MRTSPVQHILRTSKKRQPSLQKCFTRFSTKKRHHHPLRLLAACQLWTLSPISIADGVSPSLPIAQHPDESVSHLSVTPPPAPTGRLILHDRLKAVIDSLPMEVPYGIDSDDLAVFAGSPHRFNRTTKHGKTLLSIT